MFENILKFTTLRCSSLLSRTQIKQGSITVLRCISTKPTTITRLESPGFVSKLSFNKSHLYSMTKNLCISKQLTKVIGSNVVQKQFYSTHGDHVKLWKLERVVSAAFLPLLPLCFIYECSYLDTALAILSVIHVHWGLEAIIVDYARPAVVGPMFAKACFVSLYILSTLTLAGLMVLIYNGPGISKVIKQGWAIGSNK